MTRARPRVWLGFLLAAVLAALLASCHGTVGVQKDGSVVIDVPGHTGDGGEHGHGHGDDDDDDDDDYYDRSDDDDDDDD